ncbi:MAG TPA: penicillin acylase family protein [Thermohalobaculum sp.]|nr:penicillin acylase family protein [Thermohalobaculum sp.]
MTVILRWLVRIFAAAVVALAVAAALAWYLVSRSLPEYSGTLALDGLDAEVRITRDASAVPHIRAQTDADAFFALGLVHAQDRLWQMELNRRAAQGTLSAMFGTPTVGVDRLVKTLDLYGHARRAVAHQTEATQAALEAYAAGVNAWIRHVNAQALGRGAPELFLFSGALAPWTPADSLGVLKLMALRLSGAARNEIQRARFLLALPPEKVADILADDPNPALTAPPRYSALFPGARFAEAPPEPPNPPDPWMEAFGPAPRPELAGASNAWAVDGSRASGGRPLLASDPHLWLSAPGVWYLADIRGAGIAAIGGTLPGVPAVLIGRNRDLAWGLTTTGADDQDIFIEKLNPEDPGRYRTPQGWARFTSRSIRIEVAGGPAVTGVVRATRHGPVLEPDQLGVGAVTPENHVAALAWTALADEDRTMSATLGLMRAGGIDEAVAASEMVLAPVQNIVLADRSGVAMLVAGAIPRRNADSRGRGRVPSPGWVAENDWLGLRAAILNPRVIRPAEGAVANANNRITDAPYPNHISFDWDYPYRIRRLEKELSGRAFHSREGFAALQTDAVSEMARSVLPLIARDLWWRQEADAGDERRRQALDMLKRWNGAMDRHSPEPLIFYEWMRMLTRRLAADELGSLLAEVEGPRPLFVERVFRNIAGASAWCDVDKTPQAETCAQMAEAAFDDALTSLGRAYGTNLQGWRWGEAHVAVHRHTPLGQIGGLAPLFNIENETSGANYTLLRGQTPGDGPQPFRNVHAAGMRMVVDFADPDGSTMIASTGQSGHPFSRWYDHFADLWARGDTIPMSMSDEDAAAGAVGVMELRPAG